MSIKEITNNIVSSQLALENGVSEEIIYIRSDDDSQTTIKSIPLKNEEESLIKDDKVDKITFTLVNLDIKPEKSDIIFYDNTMWKILKFIRVSDGFYDIYTYNKKHNIRARY
jgi:isocitrate lyase